MLSLFLKAEKKKTDFLRPYIFKPMSYMYINQGYMNLNALIIKNKAIYEK